MSVMNGLGVAILLLASSALWSSKGKWAWLIGWGVGFLVGCLFLSFGQEFLALFLWILSTFLLLAQISFGWISGEFLSWESRTPSVQGKQLIFPLLVAVASGVAVYYGLTEIKPQTLDLGGANQGTALKDFGGQLLSRHFLVFSEIGVVFLLLIIGIGTIGRPEREGAEG